MSFLCCMLGYCDNRGKCYWMFDTDDLLVQTPGVEKQKLSKDSCDVDKTLQEVMSEQPCQSHGQCLPFITRTRTSFRGLMIIFMKWITKVNHLITVTKMKSTNESFGLESTQYTPLQRWRHLVNINTAWWHMYHLQTSTKIFFDLDMDWT